MKKLFTLIISLAVYGIAFGTDVTGTIAVNTTWNLAGSPYIVIGDITVNNGVTLTVDPNVIVKFNSGRRMTVLGTLNANTATFTSNQGVPAPNDWLYIQIGNASFAGATTLTSCFLRYAQSFYIYSGTATLSSTIIEYFYYYGIYNSGTLNMTGGSINLTGYYTSYGQGIYAASGSTAGLNGTTIIHCKNGILTETNSTVNLTSCIVTTNVWPVYYSGSGVLTISGVCDFTGNTVNAIYVNHSTHTGTWTLPTAAVPYYMYNGYTVANGSTMIIGSQNILKFRYGTTFDIRGTLTADATVGQNIFFTSERDDNWGGDTNNDGTSTAPASGNWYGIRFFDESNNASVLRRCKIRYAGYTSIGGISLYDANPTIDLCELQQNYFGALFQNTSSPTFTNNTVGSSQLTPIAMSFEANPIFTNNVLSFMDNQYDAIGLLGGTLTANANIIKRDFTTVTNITYVMLAGITVPVGLTLTIQPGIVIKSASQTYRFIIEGKLVADATLAERITLTSVKDDNFGNPLDTNKDGTITTPALGDMGAIIFANGYNPTSIMDYVLMKYATAWNYYYPNGGQNHYIYASAVATINATAPAPAGPTISNCEFRELTYGICCYQASNPTISNNAMINITGTPFAIAASANPTFIGNTFTNVGMRALGLIGNNVVVNGTIYKRDVAGYTNITYVLLEDITVISGTNLDIAAGVVIKSLYKRWYIDGGFKLNGTIAEHVVMTSLYDDNAGNPLDTNGDGNATTPARGNWYNVQFRDTSNDLYCAFTYTDVKYCGSSGAISTLNASPVINTTLIDQSDYGLWIDGNSAPSFNTVAIQNCYYDPIAISLTSNPTFTSITFSANGSNGIKIIEGTLSSNATLVKRNVAGYTNIPYIVGNLNIASGSVLTLEQGIILKFRYAGFTGITVQGGLNATGVVGQKIIFTSFKDDSSGGDTNNDGSATIPSNADWYGLIFYPESIDASNKIIYCEVRYTGGGYSAFFGTDTYNGAVRIKDAYAQIDNVIFQQGSGTALGIYGAANPAITNCQIYNYTYTPVYMAMFSAPSFSNITVSNVGMLALGIQTETYSQTATIPQRSFAGYTNITYILNGFTVNSGTTITAPAGTVFKTQSGEGIIINGKLTVSGTIGSKVIFTDYRDDGYGNPADTQQNGSATLPTTSGPYIQFNDVSDDASTIDYAIMRYTGTAIQLNSASPSITNCTFNYMNYGISNSGVCTPIVNNNTFDNLIYSPMSISLVSYPASTTGNVISGTTYKCIRVNDETLTQDVTLPKRSFGGVVNIPYFFSSYTIGTGVTLTIAPGVVCKFWYGGSMTVNNGLIAEGLATNASNIVFTSITDDFHGGDSNSDGTTSGYGGYTWQGIFVNDVALDPQTRFANCIFRYAQYSAAAGIRTINASPSILNCSFNNCYQGVQASGASNPTINFCDFYNIDLNAVNNVNQSFVINAENCWWGSNTGPTHSGNPGGIGEPVTNSVDYLPFGTSGTINPLMGDVSLNGIIQAYDASLVLQHVLVPFLNAKQQVVADVSGAAGITALDASLILQYVVGLISYFPAELLSPLPPYTSEAGLAIGNYTAIPGEEFDLPLQMTNVDGVFAGQITLNYDPEYLEAIEIINQMAEMTLLSDIDEINGIIRISFAGIEELESDLTIANIHFKAKENAPSLTIPIEGKFFMANESNLTGNITNGSVTINGFATGFENNLEGKDNLLACYPNPVTDELTIDYNVGKEGDNVFIAVYDLFGQMVAEIANGRHAADSYKITWNCNGQNGIKLPNGTYFIRMVSGNKTIVQKIQIVK
jgi:flagellar hook assembly protein FlgD